ncbi:unnamed protein product [Citrullus colocynthis]|uniref:Uncharacterized protein n=1 Tax=Citrullus colocynthis TaxID=252529 RepID=A0ABP0ZFW2_9ROSI
MSFLHSSASAALLKRLKSTTGSSIPPPSPRHFPSPPPLFRPTGSLKPQSKCTILFDKKVFFPDLNGCSSRPPSQLHASRPIPSPSLSFLQPSVAFLSSPESRSWSVAPVVRRSLQLPALAVLSAVCRPPSSPLGHHTVRQGVEILDSIGFTAVQRGVGVILLARSF